MSENILWRSVVKWHFNLQGYSNCSSHYNSGSLLLLAAIVAALAQCARARPTFLRIAVEPHLLSIFDLSTKMYRGIQQRGAEVEPPIEVEAALQLQAIYSQRLRCLPQQVCPSITVRLLHHKLANAAVLDLKNCLSKQGLTPA